MRSIATIFMAGALVAFASAASATVRIVNNNANSPAQYTDLQVAINASAVNDTVYIQGSQNTYGGITITKRMVIIGAGYNTNMTSTLGSVTLDTNTSASPATPISGVRIVGCVVGGVAFAPTASGYIHNVVLERNKIGSINIGGNGWIIRNNTVDQGNIYLNNFSNYIISNNVFAPGRIYGGSSSSGVLVANNVFIADLSGNCLHQLSNAIIINNVFWYNSASFISNVLGSVFNNNVVYSSTSLSLPPAGNTGASNQNNVNPNFINLPTTATAASVYTYNFGYTSGSVAINGGTDGSNIGVTGGAYPMQFFTGISPIPLVTDLNINNPIVYPNQQLNVNFKAKKIN